MCMKTTDHQKYHTDFQLSPSQIGQCMTIYSRRGKRNGQDIKNKSGLLFENCQNTGICEIINLYKR